MAASARKFCTCFKLKQDRINWYPDRNPKIFHSLIEPKPHVLVVNEKDLIDGMNLKAVEVKCQEENNLNALFTNCLSQHCEGLKKIIPLATNLIQNNSLLSDQKSTYTLMVVGVPNVGKSSVINALRNINLGRGKAASVGAVPEVTKSVQNEIKVSIDPVINLIDTPGILTPCIPNAEWGMKLAICSCIKDRVVGIENTADFLLYWINRCVNFAYVKRFGLKKPVDDIFPLLVKIDVNNNFMKKVKNIVKNSIKVIPNTQHAAESMV